MSILREYEGRVLLKGHNLGRREVGDMNNQCIERVRVGDVLKESLGDGGRAVGVVSGSESG